MSGEPAASCPRCRRDGIVSEDQPRAEKRVRNRQGTPGRIRFRCICGSIWEVPIDDAELHGRFMDKSGLR